MSVSDGTDAVGNDTKIEQYFSHVRRDVFDLLPRRFDRIFELGCSNGGTLAAIRDRYSPAFVAGMDIDGPSVEQAKAVCDLAICGDVESGALHSEIRDIDVILCLDVLEHLRDPWSVVAKLHERLAPGGVIIASIPNIRNWRASLPLLFLGRWELADSGVLDRTHLRFFVKKTATELMTSSGLKLVTVRRGDLVRVLKGLDLVTFGLIQTFLAKQFTIKVQRD